MKRECHHLRFNFHPIRCSQQLIKSMPAIKSSLHLDRLQASYGWLPPDKLSEPREPAAHQLIKHLRRAVRSNLQSKSERQPTSINLLTDNNGSESPFAIFCEFDSTPKTEELYEIHRLCWNFSQVPLLIVSEPTLLRVWSLLDLPSSAGGERQPPDPIGEAAWVNDDFRDLTINLHWVYLSSRQFFKEKKFAPHFNEANRADKTLLKNLRAVKDILLADELIQGSIDEKKEIVHDLLSRVIFLQFLWDRKDKDGRSALNSDFLADLYRRSELRETHTSLASILSSKEETYRFFEFLGRHFNGDLFPNNKKRPHAGYKSDLEQERRLVSETAIQRLAEFVSGELDISTGQVALWPLYSFDTVPLDLICSIYEQFVEGREGAHYTPAHLADLVLDRVLPWNGDPDVTLLDPSCGSGVFLIKAFERLLYRWERKFERAPKAKEIVDLLSESIFGIDKNQHAVRVASLGLYLAICDHIEPKQYWRIVHFPSLRGSNLIADDFFSFNNPLSNDNEYDIIIGNPPWGDDAQPSEDAMEWARTNNWPLVDLQIGTMFLAKSVTLLSTTGMVSMVQPAMALLYNSSPNAVAFRHLFFERIAISEIVNLAAHRQILFPHSQSPVCIVTGGKDTTDEIIYKCPKPYNSTEDAYSFRFDEYGSHTIEKEEVNHPAIWKVLFWGGRRDLELIDRLLSLPRLDSIAENVALNIEDGFIRGNREDDLWVESIGKKVLEGRGGLWKSLPLMASIESFPVNHDPKFERSRSDSESIYQLPVLIFNKTLRPAEGRFKAVHVESDSSGSELLFSSSSVGIHVSSVSVFQYLFALLNSKLSAYFYFMTASRLAIYRPTIYTHELYSLPISSHYEKLKIPSNPSLEDIDDAVSGLFGLNDAERILVDDLSSAMINHKFDSSLAVSMTDTSAMDSYSSILADCLRSGLGNDESFSATLYRSPSTSNCGYCVLGLHVGLKGTDYLQIEDYEVFDDFVWNLLLQQQPSASYINQRMARVYLSHPIDGVSVPTIFIVKPNEKGFWTRSVALRDADSIALDILFWSGRSTKPAKPIESSHSKRSNRTVPKENEAAKLAHKR